MPHEPSAPVTSSSARRRARGQRLGDEEPRRVLLSRPRPDESIADDDRPLDVGGERPRPHRSDAAQRPGLPDVGSPRRRAPCRSGSASRRCRRRERRGWRGRRGRTATARPPTKTDSSKTARGRRSSPTNTTLRPRLFHAPRPSSATTRPMPCGCEFRTRLSGYESISTPRGAGHSTCSSAPQHVLGLDRVEAAAARPGTGAAATRSRGGRRARCTRSRPRRRRRRRRSGPRSRRGCAATAGRRPGWRGRS